MKLIYTLFALLALTACGSDGSSPASDPYAVSRTLIYNQDYETNSMVMYTQHLPYPGNDVLIIDDKTGGGGNGCSGRIQTTQDGATFTLLTFAGACAHLNGIYSYNLTRQCQGYSQVQLICGSTSLIEIIMSKQ